MLANAAESPAASCFRYFRSVDTFFLIAAIFSFRDIETGFRLVRIDVKNFSDDRVAN